MYELIIITTNNCLVINIKTVINMVIYIKIQIALLKIFMSMIRLWKLTINSSAH